MPHNLSCSSLNPSDPSLLVTALTTNTPAISLSSQHLSSQRRSLNTHNDIMIVLKTIGSSVVLHLGLNAHNPRRSSSLEEERGMLLSGVN